MGLYGVCFVTRDHTHTFFLNSTVHMYIDMDSVPKKVSKISHSQGILMLLNCFSVL